MIVKSLLGYASFGEAGHAPAGHRNPASPESIRVVLLVAVPFGAGAAVTFINAW